MRVAARLLLLLSSFSLLGNSCSNEEVTQEWQQRERRVKDLDTGLTRLAQTIKKEVGAPTCRESAECRLVGLGAKVCGGYHDFLVYSVKTTQEQTLLPLIAEFNKLAEEQQNFSFQVAKCGQAMGQVQCGVEGCVPVK